MFPIDFHKDRALHLLERVRCGQSLEPSPSDIWMAQDLVTVAAVCQTAIRSLGPPEYRVRYRHDLQKIAAALCKLHPEHQEFVTRQCDADLLAAIDLSSHLVTLADCEGFDEYFEPNVQAIVGQKITPRKLIATKGFKGKNDGPATVVV